MAETTTQSDPMTEPGPSDPQKNEKPGATKGQADKQTPEQWAKVLGQTKGRAAVQVGPPTTRFSTRHRVADVVHGWTRHRQHTADALLITKDDYLAALESACPKPLKPEEKIDKDGKPKRDEKGRPLGNPDSKPHAPACSPFAREQKKD